MFGMLLSWFLLIWDTFSLDNFLFFMYIYRRFWDFLRVLLGGSSVEGEFNMELREHSGLALFCLNGLLSCPDKMAQSFFYSLIFEKSYRNSKVRFSNSKIDQNPDFLKLGQRPPGWSLPTFVDWKCVWNPSIWCWEWVLVVFCLFEATFFCICFFCKAYAWIFEIFREHLGGSLGPSELDLELCEYSDLILFFLNALISCPIAMQKSFFY